MIAPDVCQRWRERLDSYRPSSDDRFEKRAHGWDRVPRDLAREFVERHHYSASFPAEVFSVGLFRAGVDGLAGVAVFSQPSSQEVLDDIPGGREAGTVLGRFVLLDQVEKLGETWFLARALRLVAREGYTGVLSDSDPAPTRREDGQIAFRGHFGLIYQAGNARYLGRSNRATRYLLPDGRFFNGRAVSKVRGRERNWRGPVETLMRFGARSPGRNPSPETLRAWLARWRARICRTVRHPGNHRYLFPLHRSAEVYGPFRPRPRAIDAQVLG